jgi:hypothetical protein
MKLKKKVKKTIIAIIIVAVLIVGGIFAYKHYSTNNDKEIKVVDKIPKYGYRLKENKPERYKKMFNELKEILTKDKVDDEAYAKKISEMFIYDFYSLNDKAAKTDIGGVDFVYKDILENFLQNAQDTYYKYVESNIYNNRKQKLPTVDKIDIKEITQKEYAYGDNTDEKAYYVDVNWTYTDEDYSDYQNEATLVFIHDDIKLCLVELE